MKLGTAIVIAAIVIAGSVVLAQNKSQSPLLELGAGHAAARAGACAFTSGGWTIVDCSAAAAASSAQLNAFSRYVVQCTDDSYFAPGTAATGQDADSSDGYVPNGAWLEFVTTGDVRFYSCLNKNADNDCRHIECL